ncbi:MAG: hypothetical protein IKA65_11080 [Lentisphaeria bacterium]|nr:hypothetical protein [Lentisphaeria bacterium]
MIKNIFSVLVLSACLAVPAQNLLKNGAFDNADFSGELAIQQTHGRVKVVLETENLTWNRCLRMQIVHLKNTAEAQLLNTLVRVGKNGKNMGFPVEPDTTYDFSFEIKGTRSVALWATLYDRSCGVEKQWSGKNIRPRPANAKGEKENWTKIKGSFRTNKDTKFATLNFQFWADSRQSKKMPAVGEYVLLDNIKISKRNTITAAGSVGNASAEIPRPAMLVPGRMDFQLQQISKTAAVPVSVESSADAENIKFSITLPPGAADLKTVSENSSKLWQDDVVELFFAPLGSDRGYTQFALASGGGRFYKAGETTGAFDQWQGKCEILKDNKRKFSFVIPWHLLGAGNKIADGTLIGFNIGVQFNKKSYTFSSIKVNFRDMKNFGSLIFGSVKAYRKKAAESLKAVPEELSAEVKKFSSSSNNDPGLAVAEFAALQKKINSVRLGKAVFLTAKLGLNNDFSYPLEITPDQLINSDIKLSAARGEIVYLPLAIMNRTGKTAAYRVVVHNDKNNFNSAEVTGLTGDFPSKNIIFREALLIKDSNGKNPGMIYDPLPEMNQARVITVPANGTGVVFVEFDCHGVKPGKYTGSVRIVPLAEPAAFKRYNYQGAMKDHPLELEVINAELPPPMPVNMFTMGISQDYVNKSQRLGEPRLMISSFYFPFKFDEKGNLVSNKAPAAEKAIERCKKFFQNAPRKDKVRFMVGYSIYDVFKRSVMPKSIKVFTPEWENCWKNYFKAMCKVIADCGIQPADICYEMVDEPRIKYEKEYLAMIKLAKEAVPEARLMMTWGPLNFGYTAEKIQPYESYVSVHYYHWLLLRSPKLVEHIKRMNNAPGVTTGLYECSTNIRENLHSYFSLHPWRVCLDGFDEVGFYQFTASPWGQVGAVDWKLSPRGELTYRVDDLCVPSIRMLALQQGVDDIRYLRKLEEYPNIPEIAGLLKEYKAKVLKQVHNSALPAEFRQKARKLLKKYSGK